MKKIITLCCMLFCIANAQLTPEVTSWKINTNGATGYGNIPSNVQQVQYSPANVYVSCTSIPSYSIGPWATNPNIPSNQNFVYKITRNPQQATTPVAVGLGHTGVWSNGVSIYNANDGMSYNNQGVWQRNAYFWEGVSFDNCLGHPAQNGEYHHHVSPKCLYNIYDSTNHSPIIGYAFDGFPIYGAYGYVTANTAGSVKRMRSSYRTRSITVRNTLPNGNTASSNGPPINATYPLGAYLQDYEYVQGLGDLDDHNGRLCVTPEYPNGTYAYFVTLNDSLLPAYPYTMWGTYYGTVPQGNTGPNSGHNSITESVVTYSAITGLGEHQKIQFGLFPNPASGALMVEIPPGYFDNMLLQMYDQIGNSVMQYSNVQSSTTFALDLTGLEAGIYFIRISQGNNSETRKVMVLK